MKLVSECQVVKSECPGFSYRYLFVLVDYIPFPSALQHQLFIVLSDSLLIGFSLDSVTSCLYYFGSVRKMDATGEHPIKQNKPDFQKDKCHSFLHL